MKTLLLASAVAAMATFSVAPSASAAPVAHVPYAYMTGHIYPRLLHVQRGISYGTGYHGAGSITGGPSGGLPNRN